MDTLESQSFKYFRIWIVSSIALVALIFSFNFLIDPLWFNNGNKFSKINYAYNERISKINYFLNNRDDYDCLLFGSSVSIVFDSSLIKDSNCFNFSVSAGGLQEFIAYLNYLKWYGYEPRKVFIEINFGFVEPDGDLSRLPKSILEKDAPVNIIKSYTSIDSLVFSVKSLLGLSPYQHYYDNNFAAHVRKELTYPFNPKKNDIYNNIAEPPSKNIINYYKNLLQIYPDAVHVGYVHPISPWSVAKYHTSGHLDTNLEIIADLSKEFDELYDFSFPSPITSSSSSTYDGSHFYEYVFYELANTLNNKKDVMGYRLNYDDKANYKKLYIKKINDFIDTI